MEQYSFTYFLSPAGRRGGEAVVPLPNPGEGGPVYSGDEPVIPLPDLGEGGPVYPGDEPMLPLPDLGEGGPVYPGDHIPVVPLPNPGEGGPVYPGDGGISQTRFLNAAFDYPPFRVLVGNSRFASRLGYASITGYGRIRAGYQTVTVAGSNGYIYLRKSMPFQAGGLTTTAIIRTPSGLDLMQIPDRCCPPSGNFSSLRIGNLAPNSRPLDVLMSDGRVIYSDLQYKEVPAFRRIFPGTYQFFYADTNQRPMPSRMDIQPMDPAWLGVYPPVETFGSLILDVTGREIITVYLLQKGTGRNNIQNFILVDR